LAYSCQKEQKFEAPATLNSEKLTAENLVTGDAAKFIAENIYLSNNIITQSVSEGSSRSLKTVRQIDSMRYVPDRNGITAFFIINYEGGGFLILSGDKRAAPVMA